MLSSFLDPQIKNNTTIDNLTIIDANLKGKNLRYRKRNEKIELFKPSADERRTIGNTQWIDFSVLQSVKNLKTIVFIQCEFPSDIPFSHPTLEEITFRRSPFWTTFSLGDLPQLRLIISEQVKLFYSSQTKLPSLKRLVYYGFNSDSSEWISQVVSLESLVLHNGNVSSFVKGLSSLTSLHSLTLRDTKLKKVPAEIFKLQGLKELTLSHNTISCIPSGISFLTRLEHLDLSFNKIKSVPNEMSHLFSLEKLSLIANPIESFACQFGTSLTFLDVSRTGVFSLSNGTNALLEFHSSYCKWKKVPLELCSWRSLKVLDLSRNRLGRVPKDLKRLTALESLNLSWNKLLRFPPAVLNLIQLLSLDLGKNQIKEIPNEVRQLSRLRKLDLRWNHLTDLPESIVLMSSLEKLNIQENKITKLPLQIGLLAALKKIHLCENPLVSLPLSTRKWAKQCQIIVTNHLLEAVSTINHYEYCLYHKNLQVQSNPQTDEAIPEIDTLLELCLSFIAKTSTNWKEYESVIPVEVFSQFKELNLCEGCLVGFIHVYPFFHQQEGVNFVQHFCSRCFQIKISSH